MSLLKGSRHTNKQSTNAGLAGHPRDGGESRDAAGGARPCRRPREAAEALCPTGVGLARPPAEARVAGPPSSSCARCLSRCVPEPLARCVSRCLAVRARAAEEGGRAGAVPSCLSLSHLSLQTRPRPHPEDPRDGEGEEGGGSGRARAVLGRSWGHSRIIPLLTCPPHRFLFGLC